MRCQNIWMWSTSTSIFSCYMNYESFLHTCSRFSSGKEKGENNTMSRPFLWRGSLVGLLTYPWHGIRGLLLCISACAALIIRCDETEIVHYIDCVGLHYHRLRIPLFDPKLRLNASKIWSTTFNQIYRLANSGDFFYALSLSVSHTTNCLSIITGKL